MSNRNEKRSLSVFIAETLKINKDLVAKDLQSFLEIMKDRNQNNLNISIVERKNVNAKKSINAMDHYDYATLFSFSLNQNGYSIARYIEKYPENVDLISNNNSDITKLEEMRIKAIITAGNRIKQINSYLPLVKINLRLIVSEGEVEINSHTLRIIQEGARKLKILPFVI